MFSSGKVLRRRTVQCRLRIQLLGRSSRVRRYAPRRADSRVSQRVRRSGIAPEAFRSRFIRRQIAGEQSFFGRSAARSTAIFHFGLHQRRFGLKSVGSRFDLVLFMRIPTPGYELAEGDPSNAERLTTGRLPDIDLPADVFLNDGQSLLSFTGFFLLQKISAAI